MTYSRDELSQLKSMLESYVTRKTIPSLSSILGESVEYRVKRTIEIGFNELDSLISESERTNVMSAVYVKCSGDLHIGTLWYFSQTELKSITKNLMGTLQVPTCDAMTVSSASEIGNMLTASIANAIHDDTGCKIHSSVPGYAYESLNTLLEFVATDLSNHCESLVASIVEFRGKNSGVEINMLLIQDRSEIPKLVP